MSLPLDARPGVPGASPQPDQTEPSRTFEQVYPDLESYFGQKLGSPGEEPSRQVFDAIAVSPIEMLEGPVDEDLVSTLDLVEERLGKAIVGGCGTRVPLGTFVVLSDNASGRIIRFGVAFDNPSDNYGIELDLAQKDGTIGVFESKTHHDGTEERVRTERAHLSPDQIGSLAQILGKHFPPRESGILSDLENSATIVESAIVLARSHFEDRDLDPMGTYLKDSEDDSQWYLALGPVWSEGNSTVHSLFGESALHMASRKGEKAEVFDLGIARTRNDIPWVYAGHKIGWHSVRGETAVQTAELAEKRLKSLLGRVTPADNTSADLASP